MPQMTIPSDWDGATWGCYLVEWPQSAEWEALLRGFITTPLRGRFWDARSGQITDAQAIGIEIEGRNNIVSCNDLVIELQNLNQTLVEVRNELNLSVSQETNLVNEIINQSNVIANASATADSYSVSSAMLSFSQHLNVDIRVIGHPSQPPLEAGEAEAGGLTTTTITDDKRCDTAYWLVEFFRTNIEGVRKVYVPGAFDVPNGVLGAVSAAAAAASSRFPGASRWLLTGAALSSLVAALRGLQRDLIVEPALDAIITWLEDDFDDIVCDIYLSADNEEDTEFIQDEIVALALTAGVPVGAAPLIRAWFNFNHLATMFYQAAEYIAPPRPIGYECCPSPGE